MSYISRSEKQSVLRILYVRDGPFCCWCDRELLELEKIPYVTSGRLPRNYPTLDHVMKRAHNGANKPFNYRLSCPSCNSKRDKKMKEHSIENSIERPNTVS